MRKAVKGMQFSGYIKTCSTQTPRGGLIVGTGYWREEIEGLIMGLCMKEETQERDDKWETGDRGRETKRWNVIPFTSFHFNPFAVSHHSYNSYSKYHPFLPPFPATLNRNFKSTAKTK